ncbi:hypothetical protein B0H66DRAFT_370734 [Apodospora peruviana]|uniref:Uncharacterized protein n=1 Tax=Apodospora peruviana TaxID=516989 RepID=A0AAE0HWX1_9PEZI|nr:hypothetical protein B0H66DRAFT_370734 [Apodospora peruviana]
MIYVLLGLGTTVCHSRFPATRRMSPNIVESWSVTSSTGSSSMGPSTTGEELATVFLLFESPTGTRIFEWMICSVLQATLYLRLPEVLHSRQIISEADHQKHEQPNIHTAKTSLRNTHRLQSSPRVIEQSIQCCIEAGCQKSLAINLLGLFPPQSLTRGAGESSTRKRACKVFLGRKVLFGLFGTIVDRRTFPTQSDKIFRFFNILLFMHRSAVDLD